VSIAASAAKNPLMPLPHRCDHMAKYVNAPQSFVEKHERDIEEIKKLFVDYVKAVYPRNRVADGGNEQPSVQPSLPVQGYPKLAGIDLSTLSKKKLVDLMRKYLRKHYSE
jgi:hypothetical protein